MIRALYTAGTGMIAQQQNLDVISNNLANVNTTGFRAQRAEFEDLMYQTMRSASTSQGGGTGIPEGVQIGMGSRIAATSTNFTAGSAQQTDDPLNVEIQGGGFFKVLRSDGSAAYTRNGAFKSDGNGSVVTSDGLTLDPAIKIPIGSTSVTVDTDGNVRAVAPGASSSTVVGQIQVTLFTNSGGLSRLGGNLFGETEASGPAQQFTAGTNGAGSIMGGFIEASNVQVVDEMTRMISAQRAFEINSKAIQTADDMLGIVNNLKR